MSEILDVYLDRLMKPMPLTTDSGWTQWMTTFSGIFYHVYDIAKQPNGWRTVEQPTNCLKIAQQKLLKKLQKFPPHKDAYALKGKGYIQNALRHEGSKELFRLDLESFYTSCTYDQVMSSIEDEDLKSFLMQNAHLCFINTATIHLPTGSPVSPIVSTLVLKSLDERFSKRIEEMGGVYTRYLDDISVSFKEKKDEDFKLSLRNEMVLALESAGWTVNLDKTFWTNPQVNSITVTGVDIRDKPKVTTKYIRTRMRPALDGEASRLTVIRRRYWNFKTIKTREDFLCNFSPKIKGEMAYIKSVSTEQYQKLVDYFFKRCERHTQNYKNALRASSSDAWSAFVNCVFNKTLSSLPYRYAHTYDSNRRDSATTLENQQAFLPESVLANIWEEAVNLSREDLPLSIILQLAFLRHKDDMLNAFTNPTEYSFSP